MAIERFTVRIPQATLDDLNRRLEAVRWPDELPGAGWDLGTSLGYMKSLVSYWRDRYNWREQEAALNRLPQYRFAVNGFHIHFVHVRSITGALIGRPLPRLKR
jgi:epoxide hydrolase